MGCAEQENCANDLCLFARDATPDRRAFRSMKNRTGDDATHGRSTSCGSEHRDRASRGIAHIASLQNANACRNYFAVVRRHSAKEVLYGGAAGELFPGVREDAKHCNRKSKNNDGAIGVQKMSPRQRWKSKKLRSASAKAVDPLPSPMQPRSHGRWLANCYSLRAHEANPTSISHADARCSRPTNTLWVAFSPEASSCPTARMGGLGRCHAKAAVRRGGQGRHVHRLPNCIRNRTCDQAARSDVKCQSTKSLRSSPLRGARAERP